MRKYSFILILLTLTLVNSTFAQDAVSDFLRNKANQNSASQNLETQAQQFFQAVISLEANEIYKFFHPDFVQSLGGKKGAMEIIEEEIAVSKKEDLKVVAVKLKDNGLVQNQNKSPQIIKVRVEVKAENNIAAFDGEVTAILTGNNWYFVHQNSILSSFGIKEFKQNSTESKSNALSGGVMNGKAISLPAPEYPKAARAVGATGAVNVEVVLDEEGNVISAEAKSGHNLLRPAAVDAAKQAKFKPTIIDGKARKVIGTIVYNFSK